MEFSLFFRAFKMGFHAYFPRMKSTVPKESTIQNNKPIPGLTSSIF